jgi:hypothetical protein
MPRVEAKLNSNDPLIRAHEYCILNRAELERSDACGCFYCERIFHPNEINEWTDDEKTALCPYCGIDSVPASSTGWVEKSFLQCGAAGEIAEDTLVLWLRERLTQAKGQPRG